MIFHTNAVLLQIQERQDDPLVYHHGIKAKWTLATITAQRSIQRRVPEIQIPFFLLHGSEDTTVSMASSKFLMEHSRSEDKSMKVSIVDWSNVWKHYFSGGNGNITFLECSCLTK